MGIISHIFFTADAAPEGSMVMLGGSEITLQMQKEVYEEEKPDTEDKED